jgi:hypothetical protein
MEMLALNLEYCHPSPDQQKGILKIISQVDVISISPDFQVNWRQNNEEYFQH